MINATVLNAKLEIGALVGKYEFLQLPAPEDRILIPELSGALGLWRVLYTEHSPREIPESPAARPTAEARIFAEWIADVTP